MPAGDDSTILIAEPGNSAFLAGLLRSLYGSARVAADADEVFRIARKESIRQAVVAIELTVAGETVLSRLAGLPSLERLIAIGPPGQAGLERQARQAGADVYLSRPAPIARLLEALNAPGARGTGNLEAVGQRNRTRGSPRPAGRRRQNQRSVTQNREHDDEQH